MAAPAAGEGPLSELLTSGLVLPSLILMGLGWAVPKLLSLRWPEGVRPLFWLAATSALILLALSALAFLGLYLMQGVPLSALFEAGAWPGVWHFLRLALLSALFWGPILVLSVSSLPRHWRTEVW